MKDARAMDREQLRRLRDLRGWTQAKAAEEAGVTENTWARWERGEMAVHVARVPLLQRTLEQAEKRAARKAAKAAAG